MQCCQRRGVSRRIYCRDDAVVLVLQDGAIQRVTRAVMGIYCQPSNQVRPEDALSVDLQTLKGQYDTVVCTYVVSAVSKAVAESILQDIFSVLKANGTAYFVVPRNLPKDGKLAGYARRPQSNVVMRGQGVSTVHFEMKRYEVYAVSASQVEKIELSGFYQRAK